MREIRLHVPQPLQSGELVELPPEVVRHVRQVLRLREGAEVVLFDGRGGEFVAHLQSAGRAGMLARVGEHRAIERESPLGITLLQGIARGERMDFVVQKATELGVQRIVPVMMARCVVQLGADRADRRREHWLAVAASACEQCGRNRLPLISEPVTLAAACDARAESLRWLLDPEADITLREALAAATVAAAPVQQITLLVGPEGGLEPQEQQLAIQAGFRALRFGPRILRTETAALATIAALQCLAGDLS
ncbi:MAG: 16S rRNA (uracil(1498)-N(3))-methyltransferase [Sinobacteraceae bacterium]|nr:16S rRNA (uracil(1498)-N(3))-methyltransferase [Nevskiaceae bacterium]